MTTKLTTWRLPGFGINGSAGFNIPSYTNTVSIIAADPTATTFALACPSPPCGPLATITIGAYAEITPPPSGDGIYGIHYPSQSTTLYIPDRPSATVTGGTFSLNCDIVSQTSVRVCTETLSFPITASSLTQIIEPNYVITLPAPSYQGYAMGEAPFLITGGVEKLPATAEALPTGYSFSQDQAVTTGSGVRYSDGVFYGSTVPPVVAATTKVHKGAAKRMVVNIGTLGVMWLFAGLVAL